MALVGAVGAAGPLAVDPFAGRGLAGILSLRQETGEQVSREERAIEVPRAAARKDSKARIDLVLLGAFLIARSNEIGVGHNHLSKLRSCGGGEQSSEDRSDKPAELTLER